MAPLLSQTVQKTPTKNEAADLENPIKADEAPLPLRSLMIRPILMSVACYALLALLDIAFRAMVPLFYSTPIEFGGLGQSPAWIGSMMSVFGIMNGVVQAFLFPVLIECWGPRRVFVTGMAMFAVLFAIFPIINSLARVSGLSMPVMMLVIGQLALSIVCDMAYGMFDSLAVGIGPDLLCPSFHLHVCRSGIAQQKITRRHQRLGPSLRLRSACFGPRNVYFALCSICRVQLAGWQRCLRDPGLRHPPDPHRRYPVARKTLERGH